MRLATLPPTWWPPAEPRSRIALYAWFPPLADEGSGEAESSRPAQVHDIACSFDIETEARPTK